MGTRFLDTACRALVISETEPARIETVRTRALEEGEARVAPAYWGVCGSDMKLFAGTYALPRKKTLIPGHEWVGYIKELGPDVQGFSIGERVTGECSVFCGQCFFCREVNKNLCERIRKHGISTDGFASSTAIIHQRHLHSLAEVSFDDELGIFIEPLAVVLQGLKEIRQELSGARNILILGAGTIGLLTGLALLDRNRQLSVSIADANKKRLGIAQRLGMKPIACDLQTLAAHLEGQSFDILVESSGFDGYIDVVQMFIRPGGEVLLFTASSTATVPVEMIVRGMITFHGNLGGAGSFPEAIRLVSQNADRLSLLVDNIIEFEQLPGILNHGIEKLSSGVKTIIKMPC